MRGALSRQWRYWPLCTLALALVTLVAQTSSVPAQPVPAPALVTHAQRSAAVASTVLGIISYTHWPVDPQSLRLCVVADPEYADSLLHDDLQLAGKKIAVRKMDVADATIGTACDVVYLGALTEGQRLALSGNLTGHPVLSISEANTACAVGSMFCLRIGVTRVSFLVNLDSIARSGVRVDPQVLLLSAGAGEQP